MWQNATALATSSGIFIADQVIADPIEAGLRTDRVGSRTKEGMIAVVLRGDPDDPPSKTPGPQLANELIALAVVEVVVDQDGVERLRARPSPASASVEQQVTSWAARNSSVTVCA